MNLQTKIPLTNAANPIDYTSQILLLGSCFSENIGEKLAYFKFQNLQNPFGILFHPLAIENLVIRAVEQRYYTQDEVFFQNERWHCFDAHSDLSGVSRENLLKTLNARLALTAKQVTNASHIIITLGTSWVYKKKDTGAFVANCHRVPQKEFVKELLSADAILKSLKNTVRTIQEVNEKAQLVFTVSPVRHLKDGFVENQRSKSHLIAAIHAAMFPRAQSRGLSYFESYELLMDELRDYRFYEADMVHPNQLAIDYIWEKFKEVWISESAVKTMNKVEEIQKGLAHRPFHGASEQHKEFRKSLGKKIAYLQQAYDFMEFGF